MGYFSPSRHKSKRGIAAGFRLRQHRLESLCYQNI
jgi:hypothetical protein